MDSKSYRTDALRKLFLLPFVFIIAAINCNQVNPSQPVSTINRVDVRAFCVSGPYLFAGTYEGGVFRSADNGENWTAVNTGLTNTCVGRTNVSVLSFAVSGNSIFAGTGYDQGIFLSTNNGESWEPVNSGLPVVYPLTCLTIPALIVRGDSIFAGTGTSGVFLSTNNGKSWKDVSSGLTSHESSSGHMWKCAVSSFAECRGDLFAGTYDGVFRLTHNDDAGTIQWTAVSSGLESSGRYVTELAVSGSNLFAGTLDGVFLSTDKGASWKLVSSGISDIPQPHAYNPIITSVFVSGNRLFASRQWGVFLSTDNGASWTAVRSGLSGQCVWTFFQSGNTLFAGTQSGGIFRSMDNGDNWTAVNSGLH